MLEVLREMGTVARTEEVLAEMQEEAERARRRILGLGGGRRGGEDARTRLRQEEEEEEEDEQEEEQGEQEDEENIDNILAHLDQDRQQEAYDYYESANQSGHNNSSSSMLQFVPISPGEVGEDPSMYEYSPPKPSRAEEYVRLARKGRVEEAQMREARRASSMR